jgi:hypothetical protein
MKANTLLLVALLTLATGWPAQAQTEKKPLTNQDIIGMVKAGLAETVVVAAIQSNPANYDTSPAALIELQKANVSAKVQETMLAAQNSQPPAAPTPAPGAPAASVLPDVSSAGAIGTLNRVFVLQGNDRTEMKQNKAEYDTIAAPFFSKVFLKFEGKLAECRLSNPTPVFEITLPGNWVASEHVKLVKPDVKKERRELTVQGMAGPGVPIRPDKKANIPLVFEEVRKESSPGFQVTIHHAKPAKPISPGEYVLAMDSVYYCFGLEGGK